MLQMLVERRELVAIEMHDTPAALTFKEAAVCRAAVRAELIVRALVRRDLVDAALPLKLFQLPVDRGNADARTALAQRIGIATALTGSSARSERQSSTAFCCLVV